MKQPEVHLYRAADYPRMPWRNGGGTTQEVVCNPGGSAAGFDWRLSIADVAQDGGFSAFTGYQRIITVLEGSGIQLTVDGSLQTPLTPRQAYAFAGEAQVQCRLLDGPIRDFNLIYAPARLGCASTASRKCCRRVTTACMPSPWTAWPNTGWRPKRRWTPA
jgi:environmental stress-induced protein Ves